MSEFRIVHDYPDSQNKLWHALTDPDVIRQWTTTGAGGRAEGFTPVAGTRFQYIAKPKPGWNGVVDCEVLEVDAPNLVRHSWLGDGDKKTTEITFRLEPLPTGTRLTYEHTGFTGLQGFLMSRLLKRVRTKMLTRGLPSVLATLPDGTR